MQQAQQAALGAAGRGGPGGRGPMQAMQGIPPNMAAAMGGPGMFPQAARQQGGGMRGGPNQVRGFPPNARGGMPPQMTQQAAMPQPGMHDTISVQAQIMSAPPQQRKQLLGEALFPKIQIMQPELAGKITGMLLEMEDQELLNLCDDEPALRAKVDEALNVYDEYVKNQEKESGNQHDDSKGKDEKA